MLCSLDHRRWLAVFLAAGLTGCSFIVDDSPYACTGGAPCASDMRAPVCESSSDCGGTTPHCFEGACYACMPQRLCEDDASLCVRDTAGPRASCQPLLDPDRECNFTYPRDLDSLRNEDIFAFGVIADLGGNGNEPSAEDPTAAYGVPWALAVQTAIAMIHDSAVGGLPVQPATRKLLAIFCDETTPDPSGNDRDTVLKARVDHLAETLGVPAIIGGSKSTATGLINARYLEGRETLLLSPSATADGLPEVRRNAFSEQLLWRTVTPDARQAQALKSAQELAAVAARKNTTKLDVVSVYDDDNTASSGLQDRMSAFYNFADSPTYAENDDASQAMAVARILRAKPAFIMPFGTEEFVAKMLAKVEEDWDESLSYRPWYIMSEGNRTNYMSALARMDLVDRVIGTAPGARSAEFYRAFRSDYKRVFNTTREPANLAECGYDAVYMLSYAAIRASREGAWPRGRQLAAAISTLSCKDEGAKPLRASRADFAAHARVLARATDEGCFDFDGASGPVDYAPVDDSSDATQELSAASSDIALWCLGRPNDKDQTVNMKHYFKQPEGATPGMILALPDSMAGALSLDKPGWCAADAN